MAIAVTSTKKTIFGNKKIVIITGTFDNADTTGDIVTGLVQVDFAVGGYTEALAKVINVSATGGTLTVATEDPGATKAFSIMVVGH
jgi:hypothetical protein